MAKKAKKKPAKKAAKKKVSKKLPAKKAAKKGISKKERKEFEDSAENVDSKTMSDSTKLFLSNNFSRSTIVINQNNDSKSKKDKSVAKSESIEKTNKKLVDSVMDNSMIQNHYDLLRKDKSIKLMYENSKDLTNRIHGVEKKSKKTK